MTEHGKQTDEEEADVLRQEVARLRDEAALLREAADEYWRGYHDEHCTGMWPHTRGEGCGYPPPAVLGYS